MNLEEYRLRNAGVNWFACSSKMVKRYLKPLIYAFMYVMKIITKGLRVGLFLEGFDLCCSSILISTTDIEDIMSHLSAESSIDIC